MAVNVSMPKWGLTMEGGCINQWLKQEGENVEKDEPLLEMETDKLVSVVESPASGILARIIHHTGIKSHRDLKQWIIIYQQGSSIGVKSPIDVSCSI